MFSRIVSRPRLGLVMLLLLLIGCGEASTRSSGDRPVVAPDLNLTPALSSDAVPVPRVAMILPRSRSQEVGIWEQAARRTAGSQKATFEVLRPSGSVAGGQAELIAQAVQAGASVLIVLPEDPEALGPALVDARAQGVPAVSLLRPIPVPGEPIPVLVRTPSKDLVETLVRAVQEDAQLVGHDPEGPALLLANEGVREAHERAEVLAEVAEAAGLRLFGNGPQWFQGAAKEARERLQAVLEEEPGLAIVLVTDDNGFRGATAVREQLPPDDRYVMTGFIGDRQNMNMVFAAFASAAAEFNNVDFGSLAARTALRLHRGEEVPAEIVVEPRVHRASGPPSREELGFQETGDRAGPLRR